MRFGRPLSAQFKRDSLATITLSAKSLIFEKLSLDRQRMPEVKLGRLQLQATISGRCSRIAAKVATKRFVRRIVTFEATDRISRYNIVSVAKPTVPVRI
jgi:hypothetical protein